MFTDILGYTALMGADEENALKVLRKSREIQKVSISEWRGKWLKDMGDGILAQFESAYDAVKCAIAIQQKAHAELEAKIRIGINLGDVTIENDDVFGDGVNIASRLQAIADPGGIYISESVHTAISGRSDISCKYLGAVQLKNVEHPIKTYYLSDNWLPMPSAQKVRELSTVHRKRFLKLPVAIISVFMLVVIVIATSQWWLPRRNISTRLAILPVKDLSGKENKQFILEGIHSSLIDQIGMVSAFQVISRTSSSKYKDTEKTIPEIAQELHIDMVVESELIEMDDSVELRFRLIQAFPEEQQRWQKVYRKPIRSVLKIYDDVAMELSNAIHVDLSSREKTYLSAARDVNPNAYRAYLKSQFHYNNFTPHDFELGIQSLELALKYDPNYLMAYIGTAQMWIGMAQMGIVPYKEAYPKIKNAVDKVLELNIENAQVHDILALKAFEEWSWEEGLSEFEKAIAINPNDSWARTNYAYVLAIVQSHDKAKIQIDLASEIDPFNPLIESFYGWIFLYARHYEESAEHSLTSIALAPGNWVAKDALRQAYFLTGKFDESFEVTKALQIDLGMPKVAQALESGYGGGNYQEAMVRAADAMVAHADSVFISPEAIAETYAYARKYDLAMDWLEKAFIAHDPEMHYIGVVPIYDGLRNRPRFQELIRRMNLEPKEKHNL